MLNIIWNVYLYQPLFNALIWIYSNVANQNLGWAVVWLTIFLRIFLLPLTILSQREGARQEKAEEEALNAAKSFKNDVVAQKEVIRRIMKKNRISPWAKVITLGVQLLVLVLLYQVFVRGISGDKVIKFLYSSIDYPGRINVNFYGFDIGRRHDSIWAGVCAIYLFTSIYLNSKDSKIWSPARATFLFLFPIFTFFALWMLPMVKSLFILTSMIFSDIIHLIRKFFSPAKKPVVAHH